jgi:antitoxin CcdA
MPRASGQKKRTNVTLTAENVAAARALGLNVSAISDEALARAVREARASAWAAENAAAIAERRAWIEANGTPLADLQILKTE